MGFRTPVGQAARDKPSPLRIVKRPQQQHGQREGSAQETTPLAADNTPGSADSRFPLHMVNRQGRRQALDAYPDDG